jgi:hypothetical protein
MKTSTLIFFLFLLISCVFITGCEFSNGRKSTSSVDSSTNDSFNDNSVQTGAEINEQAQACVVDESEDVNSCENPVCDQIMTLDGPGEKGFLWKPENEDGGPAVVLLPKKFVRTFQKVLITRKDGEVEEGAFTGFTNPDRQTWRFLLDGENYLPRIVAQEFKQECVWVFPDAGERQD